MGNIHQCLIFCWSLLAFLDFQKKLLNWLLLWIHFWRIKLNIPTLTDDESGFCLDPTPCNTCIYSFYLSLHSCRVSLQMRSFYYLYSQLYKQHVLLIKKRQPSKQIYMPVFFFFYQFQRIPSDQVFYYRSPAHSRQVGLMISARNGLSVMLWQCYSPPLKLQLLCDDIIGTRRPI